MTSFNFVATGDAILLRRVSSLNAPDFLQFIEILRTADAAFTNLEFTTPRYPFVPAPFRRLPLFGTPAALDDLAWCGFNLFSTANNHSGDWTYQGTVDTVAELAARELTYAGSGRTLSEARAPGYLDTGSGRAALVAASSHTINTASDPRGGIAGRPGINPLRFETDFVLDADRLRRLVEIDDSLGTGAARARRSKFDPLFDSLESEDAPSEFKFLNSNFVQGPEPGVRTRAKRRDLEDVVRWISEARRQADFVAMSLHASEGRSNDVGTPEPADFIVQTAHEAIDAGADVFVGHGPQRLRGLEIYNGKPIFYSLGMIFCTLESTPTFPAELYERYDMGPAATPADVFDYRTRDDGGRPKGWHTDPRIWQTVVPVCQYESRRLVSLDLHPVTLHLEAARGRRGVPGLAEEREGVEILEWLQEISREFATSITVSKTEQRAVGHVQI